MAATPEVTPTLLDPRLRFPIHALPDERVVWSGSAAPRAYRAMLLRAAWLLALSTGFFAAMASVPGFAMLWELKHCRIAEDADAKPVVYRDCTEREIVEQKADGLRWLTRVGSVYAGLIAAAVVLQAIGNALRRRNLVYVVTNERVVVQDGAVRLRVDTIDLDHVVSVTAEADLFDRWFGLKAIAVTVPGQRVTHWKQVSLANAIAMWGLDAQDPALSQLLNVWLPRPRH